ncbi:MAG: hypothetical protein ACK5OX_12505 [Desertimonas sp.]
MNLDANDRSRLVFASLLTAVALPTIWWANEDDATTTRPNVAAAGLAAEAAVPVTPTDATPVRVEPAFLTPASTIVTAGEPPTRRVQVGPVDDAVIGVAAGTYRSGVGAGRCEISGVGASGTITVYNAANGQSVRCSPVRGDAEGPTVVLSPGDFDTIADFTEAPIRVEVRE